jgi:secondary thiamine-phosphate synthase enzyme
MKLGEATLKSSVFTLDVETGKSPAFFDITDEVSECVRRSETRNGIALVFSKHTTAAITIQENEPLLITDMCSTLERFAPRNSHYRHNDFDVRTVHMHQNECPNGHSHCQHLVLGTSENIPIIDGQLALGEFQRIFVVELDPEKMRRQILVQMMGT